MSDRGRHSASSQVSSVYKFRLYTDSCTITANKTNSSIFIRRKLNGGSAQTKGDTDSYENAELPQGHHESPADHVYEYSDVPVQYSMYHVHVYILAKESLLPEHYFNLHSALLACVWKR